MKHNKLKKKIKKKNRLLTFSKMYMCVCVRSATIRGRRNRVTIGTKPNPQRMSSFDAGKKCNLFTIAVYQFLILRESQQF